MTKAELIEAMKDIPDDIKGDARSGIERIDPLKKVLESNCIINHMLIEPEDE